MFNELIAIDAETVPNADLLREYNDLGTELTDEEVVRRSLEIQLEKTGGKSSFLPVQFHVLTAVSMVYYNRRDTTCELVSLHEDVDEMDEKKMAKIFFQMIENMSPQIITWNGNRFDALVFQLAAVRHVLKSPKWFNGIGKFETYRNRYHTPHVDLSEEVVNFTGNHVKLDTFSKMCGLPGKIGIGGDKVYENWLEGKHKEISNYCDVDTVNTFLGFLRWEEIAGHDISDAFTSLYNRLNIARTGNPPLDEYLTELEKTDWMNKYKKSDIPEN